MIVKVTLRKQIISGNRASVLLDYYPAIEHPISGKLTRREFLNLNIFCDTEFKEVESTDNKGIKRKKFIPQYIERTDKQGNVVIKPKARKLSILEKQHNDSIMMLAEQIRQRRQNEVNRPEVYTEFEREQIRIKELGNKSFIAYFEKLCDKRQDNNRLIWLSAFKYLKAFAGRDLQFKDLNKEFCNDFKNYLLTGKSRKSKERKLAINSCLSYHNKLRAALKQAYKDGYLPYDLNGRIDSIQAEETVQVRLTLEELNSLVKTECSNPILKRAALFASLTGLRFSDIEKLTWKEVEFIKDQGFYLNFRIQKTKGIAVLPISDQAASLMGEPGDPDSKVFEGLIYSDSENKRLAQWGKDAKINKKLSWHTMRRTFATLQVSMGTDMRIIQDALGHKHMKTTELYAKSVNSLLREAMSRIKLEM